MESHTHETLVDLLSDGDKEVNDMNQVSSLLPDVVYTMLLHLNTDFFLLL